MKKLLILLVSLSVFSCTKEPDDPEQFISVVYDKFKHDASNRTDQELRWLMDDKEFIDDYYIVFSDLSKYYIKKNNGDWYRGWNKILGTYQFNLYGVDKSFGMHENSHRLVWRYNPDTDDFDVATYSYLDGVRSWEVLHEGAKVGEVVKVKDFDLKYNRKATAYFGGIYRYNRDVVIEIK